MIMMIQRQSALMSITLPTGKLLSARAETILKKCRKEVRKEVQEELHESHESKKSQFG
jgi:hypothetical protein